MSSLHVYCRNVCSLVAIKTSAPLRSLQKVNNYLYVALHVVDGEEYSSSGPQSSAATAETYLTNATQIPRVRHFSFNFQASDKSLQKNATSGI